MKSVLSCVLVMVLQRSRMGRIYMHIYITERERYQRFIVGIGSHNYGGQEVPGSAVNKLEIQQS